MFQNQIAKASVLALPLPRAENKHHDGKNRGNGSHEADVVGHSLGALEVQNPARCTAEQATGHGQPAMGVSMRTV